MVYKRRKNIGITESYWSGLNEDHKIKWKVVGRIITFFGALAVAKTGIFYIDCLIAACASAFSFLLIESQRSYARFSVGMRKALTKISIVLGGACILFVGIMYFAQVAIFALASTYTSLPTPKAGGQYYEFRSAIYLLIFLCAWIIAVVRVFRKLNIIDLIYHLPRQQMIKLLIHKQFELEGVAGFACFELGVIVATICYSGIVSTLLSGVLAIINIALSVIV